MASGWDGEDRFVEGVRRLQAQLRRYQEQHARWAQVHHARWEEAYRVRMGVEPSRRERKRMARRLEQDARHELRRSARRMARRGRGARVLSGLSILFMFLWIGSPAGAMWFLPLAVMIGMFGLMLFLAQRSAADNRDEDEVDAELVDPGSYPAPAPAKQPAIDPRLERVESLCQRLLDAFAKGPGLVREVVRKPEETVGSIRDTCRELLRREDALREVANPAEEERLAKERLELTLKLDAEADAVVRERLGGAIEALDKQLAQRKELLTAAARFEAERTRLRYVLEGLYTQVIRVQSADAGSADLAGAGMRRELERLGEELGAVAESLDAVSHGTDELPSSPLTPDPVRTR